METILSKDGVRIAYARSGEGPPLLLIHGTTADHHRWQPVLSDLERHFTVYAMDRRGRGGSSDAPDYDVAREVEDVVAMIETIGGRVSVIGHSYGAICALEATLLTPSIGKLVLYGPPIPAQDPAAVQPDADADAVEALLKSGDAAAALECFYTRVVRSPPEEIALLRTMPDWEDRIAAAHTVARETRLVRSYQLRPERFSGVGTETLLLLGSESAPTIKAAIERLRTALPNSRVGILEGQQNQAIATAPELFAQAVLAFLKGETNTSV
jgi:pimeloyl-ACP methyl ester carboxylesterase